MIESFKVFKVKNYPVAPSCGQVGTTGLTVSSRTDKYYNFAKKYSFHSKVTKISNFANILRFQKLPLKFSQLYSNKSYKQKTAFRKKSNCHTKFLKIKIDVDFFKNGA